MLYLAANPYSASAALVAVREERQNKATTSARVEVKREQGRPAETTAMAKKDQPPLGNTLETTEPPALGRLKGPLLLRVRSPAAAVPFQLRSWSSRGPPGFALLQSGRSMRPWLGAPP